MEYSLSRLSKYANFHSLKIKEVIDRLNSIGFEVDEEILQRSTTNEFLEIYRVLIKTPANRDDLLLETIFLADFSSILGIKPYDIWKKMRKNYLFLLRQKYQNSKVENPKYFLKDSNFSIYILEIRNFETGFSPLWIQRKLEEFGKSSKQNFEDVLNLIDLEWGIKFNLTSYNKYGRKVYFLNCAYYDIHNDPSRLNLSKVSSSLKYLRKMLPENIRYGFQRILTILELCYNVEINTQNLFLFLSEKHEIKLNRTLKIKKNLFLDILNIKKCEFNLFKQIGIKLICETSKLFYFEVPNHRKDLLREIDIIEEYSRFIGYQNFYENLPMKSQSIYDERKDGLEFIRKFLLSYGFYEIMSNPIQKGNQKNEMINCPTIEIENPLTIDLDSLRTELISELVETYSLNYKIKYQSSNLFEFGRIFQQREGEINEIDKLAGIFQLKKMKKGTYFNWEWFDAKAGVENLFAYFCNNNEILEFKPMEEESTLFHPTKSVYFYLNNQKVGVFGEVHPFIQKDITSKFSTYIFEINLDCLLSKTINTKISKISEYSKYPFIIKDLSFSVSKNISFSDLKRALTYCSPLINNIEFFDIYRNDKNNKRIKLGMRFEFQSLHITLTNEIIEKEMEKISSLLLKEFNAIF